MGGDKLFSVDTAYKWITGKSKTLATKTEPATVVATGSDIVVDNRDTTPAVDTNPLEGISIVVGQISLNQTPSESEDHKLSSDPEDSESGTEHSTQQKTLPSIDFFTRVDSFPPRYEEIEHIAGTLQSKEETFADAEGQTIASPTFQLEALESRAKRRRKRMEIISRLKAKRDRVVDLRLKLYELRTSIRQQRDSLSTRDAQLVQGMRFVFLGNELIGRGPLHEEFERLQEARDSLQPLQDDYDTLEDEVIREEHDLGELESRLYPLEFSAQNSTLADDELAVLDRGLGSAESSLSAHSGPAEISTQVNQYLSRKGDVHLLRERLDDLRMERAQIVEEEYRRAQVGRTLDDYSRDFLLQFDQRHEELQRELVEAEEDAARLKTLLADIEDSILDQFGGTQAEISDEDSPAGTDQNPLDPTDDILNPAESTLDAQDPLLLLGAEVPSPVFSGSVTESSRTIIGKATYINQWLLHRLRRSLHEIRRFKSTPELQDLNLNQTQIKDMTLELWFHDSSAETFARNRKRAAESHNFSAQTNQGQPGQRDTKSETNATGLQGAIRQARNNQSGPALRHSGDSLSVQPFPALFTGVSPSKFHF